MKKGLFPLSADPITYGHLATMQLALKECDELIVVIANNDEKLGQYTFSLEERFAMTQRAIQEYGLSRVHVIQSSGLVSDIFMKEGCDVVFRGIRHESDMDAEKELAALYAQIYDGMKDVSVFLQTPAAYSHVSSSWVKHFVRLGVDVSPYVPLFIKEALEQRIQQQIKIGITGEIAVGKTHVAKKLVSALQKSGHNSTHIVIDDLLHALYSEMSPGAQRVRDAIAQRFGQEVLNADRNSVNRAALAEKLFAPETSAQDILWIQQLVYPHVERLYREATTGITGILIIEWAQLVEMEMLSWVNNRVILVSTTQQNEFANARGLSNEYQAGIARMQRSTQEKATAIQSTIASTHHGTLIAYDNNTKQDADVAIKKLSDQILKEV